ncbi:MULTISPECIES: glycine zipper 2TM domain-containing protein [Erythrobacter]|uniref:17 kDa surface antigen n=1 Tax=Erythrobacter aureus TaxID=2182384 RepID=A0A345YG21_9SPHN|nr:MULTISPECIES: glycine zipper 2TM domain-containing protein [Erythrobacter]AXK42873.1 glycine zipper 2TM domain-containing protein [Erythrobacter aureus]MCF8881657.1 glycine zipper 2TM domain-containing protein [Erythrobacter sp. SN021]
MKKLTVALAAGALAFTGIGMAAPAAADPPAWAPAHGKRAKDRAIYDSRGYYIEPRRISRADRMWRGGDGRYYCKRDNGTTGLVIGAGVGALAGHELAGRGDKTLGAILGGAVGAIVGREIDRGSLKCR